MDADPGFVGLEVLRGKKAGFVGGHHRQFEPRREPNGGPQAGFLVLAARALHLHIKAILEPLRQDPRSALRTLVIAAQQRMAHLGVPGPGEQNEAVAALKHLRSGHRAGQLTTHVGQRGELNQIAVANRIAGDDRQAQRLSRLGDLVRQVHPDDRLDPRLEAGAIELDQPEEVAVVGEADGAHVEFGSAAREVVDAS